MDTNCAPLIADLFLFCYEIDFMASLSYNKEAEIIQAFNSTSRNLDDLLNIDNPYFKGQGPVIQSIVSLTSSLRGQLVKCFTTL